MKKIRLKARNYVVVETTETTNDIYVAVLAYLMKWDVSLTVTNTWHQMNWNLKTSVNTITDL